jgi:hypothetical protein
MVYSKKKKLASFLLSLCIIGSTFAMPMVASAVSTSFPQYTGSQSIAQVDSKDFKTFPDATSSSKDKPTTVFLETTSGTTIINSSTLGAYDSATTKYDTALTFYDSTFTTVSTLTSLTAKVGSITDVTTGAYTGGQTYYLTAPDGAATYYYKLVVIHPVASDANAITGITDATNLSASVTPAPGGADAANSVAVSVTLASAKTAFAASGIAISPNATVAIYDASNNAFTAATIPAGTYSVVVTSESGKNAYYTLTVNPASATPAKSTDNKIKLTLKESIVSGDNSSVTDPTAAVASGAKFNVTLPAGTYLVANTNSNLFTLDDSKATVTSVKTILNTDAAQTDPAFSQTIKTGNTYKVTITVTAEDTTKVATYEIDYTVYTDVNIYSIGAGLPTGSTLDNDPVAQNTDSTIAKDASDTTGINAYRAINVTLPLATSSVTLANAFTFVGNASSVTYSTDPTFKTGTVTSVAFTAAVPTVTVYARVNNGASPAASTDYNYYTITFTRTVDTKVLITPVAGTTATITNDADKTNITDITNKGKFDASSVTTIDISVPTPGYLNDIIKNAIQYSTDSSAATATQSNLVNPYLKLSDTSTITVDMFAEDGSKHSVTLNVSVTPNTTDATITSISTGTVVGAIPTGSVDVNFTPTVCVNIGTTVTSINATDFAAANLGTVKLYTTVANVNSGTNVTTCAIPAGQNTTTLIAAVTSADTKTTKYITVEFDTVATSAKYTVTAPTTFTKSGDNYVATVTVNRGQAAKLANPKLYVVYNLTNGEQTYQTIDLNSSDTTTKDIVVGSGFKSAFVVVVDGTVDWSLGMPTFKSSNAPTIIVPSAQ